MKILVTGASGFVGCALCKHLADRRNTVTGVTRKLDSISFSEHSTQYFQGLQADFTDVSALSPHLQGIETIVHTAARVHQVQEAAADPLAVYRRINTQATRALAQAAAEQGVKRFVFLSSVKVNGDFSSPDRPHTIHDAPAPTDAYGLSKWEAEQGLKEIAIKTGMELVIIRPPLVYGPGVKANFLTMMRWLSRGVPLPLGNIQNRRSLVALPNLLDFIRLCIENPKVNKQTFLISDQHDLSTTQLLRQLGEALHSPARLLPVPQSLLKVGLRAVGKSALAQRLCEDLAVDASPATELLGWKPPLTVQQGLQLTADHFLKHQANAAL
jgi:UDP-4-keto-D-QuiNAc 4-reductase